MATADSPTSQTSPPRWDHEVQAIKRLAKLGVDVSQLANEKLPEGVWQLIEKVVRRIRGKRRRWYAAAGMYGRALAMLKAGGTVDEVRRQFGDPRTLAPLMADPVVRETVFAAGLPTPLQRRLTDVLGQTKLWRNETLVVAAELIDRYRSELAAGRTPGELLVAQSEPPHVIARQLRRERVRQRPWWRRALHGARRAIQWSLALAFVAYLVLLCRFHLLRAVPVEVDRDRFDYAVAPVEHSAWPLYSAGFQQLEIGHTWSGIVGASHIGPESSGWPETKSHLQKVRPAIDLFLEGSQKPRLGHFDPESTRAPWFQALRETHIRPYRRARRNPPPGRSTRRVVGERSRGF